MLKKGAEANMEKYVDECFHFVSEHQKDSEVVRVPRGTRKHVKKVVNLRALLQQKKTNVSKVNMCVYLN